MYVKAPAGLFTAPFGSELLGIDAEGVPIAFYRAGWVGPMVPVKPRDPKETA